MEERRKQLLLAFFVTLEEVEDLIFSLFLSQKIKQRVFEFSRKAPVKVLLQFVFIFFPLDMSFEPATYFFRLIKRKVLAVGDLLFCFFWKRRSSIESSSHQDRGRQQMPAILASCLNC